jgi:lysophospholipase L1-like esterase
MKIVCFGDSVTRGITCLRGRLRILKENYPSLLQTMLGDPGKIEVINKGVFNDNSDLLLERVEKDVLAVFPDLVLIEIGGNDCNFRWDEVAARPDDEHSTIVPLQRYLQNVQRLMQRIRNGGAFPVLLSILPLDPQRYYRSLVRVYGTSIAHWIALCGGIAHWHGLYNYELRQWAEKSGTPFLDVRTAFKKAGPLSLLLSEDGIHPTAEGYAAMAFAVRDGLRKMAVL